MANVFEFGLLLLLAAIVGALGQALAGYSRSGCLASVVLGFAGAVVGAWLGRVLELPDVFVVRIGEQSLPVVWSILGAALLVAMLNLFTRRNAGRTGH